MQVSSYRNIFGRNLTMMMVGLLLIVSASMNVKQFIDLSSTKTLYDQTIDILGETISNSFAAWSNPPIVVERPQTIIVEKIVPAPIDPKSVITLKEVSNRDLECLTENIFFEARGQGIAGKVAVGNVTLNRVGKKGYPNSVCGVINHKIGETCMFSWKCEPKPAINKNSHEWKTSQQIAYDLLSKDRKDVIDITEGATHFHNQSVRPNWKLNRVTRIGDHTFYR